MSLTRKTKTVKLFLDLFASDNKFLVNFDIDKQILLSVIISILLLGIIFYLSVKTSGFSYRIDNETINKIKSFDNYEKTDIEAIMLNELNSQFDLTNNQIIYTLCHRWKFGEVINNQNTNPFISTKSNLYGCGDWLHKQSFIGALESGYQLAMHIAE